MIAKSMGFKRLVRGFASTCTGFKRYHLKTHTNSNESSNKSLKTHAFCKPEHTPSPANLLKPMCIAAKDTPRSKNISQYRLKPMCIAATTLKTPQRSRSRRRTFRLQPQRQEASPTHPHSFASLARTNESKSKSISRLRGVG